MNTATREERIDLGQVRPALPAPKLEAFRSNYRLRLAEGDRDVRAAQLLRFIVFNLELNEGLEQSYATCLDADAFDPICDHLIVEDMRSNEVVGTYRLQTGTVAANNHGYYSAQEFDFSALEPLRNEIVELGRACVHMDHRNLAVLTLLWKGIAAYAGARGSRYLVGCSSITSQEPAVGIAAYRALSSFLVDEQFRTNPLPAYDCGEGHAEIQSPKIPKLLSAYLALGAKICGRPAIDREFKTIDFLTFLDLQSLSPKNVARYLT
jgi:putative hemolysin